MSEQTEAREALDAATQYAWTHGDSQTAKDFLAGVEWQSARSPLTAPSEVEREAGQVPLDALLVVYRDGEERGWQAEFDFLWSEHQERMDFLATSIQETGIRAPILLGSDGRVWDGHHRLAAAHRLGLPTVPVEFASRPTPPEGMVGVTDEMVEAAAQALFENPDYAPEYTWAEMVAEDQPRADIWRADARRVLDAAALAARPLPETEEWAEEWVGYANTAIIDGEPVLVPEFKGENYATHKRTVKAGPWRLITRPPLSVPSADLGEEGGR